MQRPLILGADAVMHATTKSLAGHSDVLGGAVCVASAETADQLRKDRLALGSTPGNLEVSWLQLVELWCELSMPMDSLRFVHFSELLGIPDAVSDLQTQTVATC